MENKIQCANWWSKLLFKKKFENQFFIPLPPSFFERHVMEMIEKVFFSRDLSDLKIDRPIFIVGLPRSGTTLLYNLICSHERAAYVTNAMNSFPRALRTIEFLRHRFKWNVRGERFLADSIDVDFGSPSEPLTLWGPWMGRNFDSLYWPRQTKNDLGPERVQQIYNDIRKILFCFGGEGRRFVMKSPVMQTELELLQELFPEARFIHILRDARPAANSMVKLHQLSNQQLEKIKHPQIKSVIPYPRVKGLESYVNAYGPDSLECTTRVWKEAIELVQDTSKKLRHFYEFRYEDLVTDPHGHLKKIFDFCDLSWPQSMKFDSEIKKVGRTHHANHYRGYKEIEIVAAPLLEKLGYLNN